MAASPPLPEPREPGGPYRIGIVCLGNICRSPTAHVILEAALDDAGLADRVVVDSAGTGDWHVGNPMDDRAARTLTAHGYDPTRHRAQHFKADWYARHDLLLAMDRTNYADMADLAPDELSAQRLRMFRDFDPEEPGAEVPDPYYGGLDGFEEVIELIRRSSDSLVSELTAALR